MTIDEDVASDTRFSTLWVDVAVDADEVAGGAVTFGA